MEHMEDVAWSLIAMVVFMLCTIMIAVVVAAFAAAFLALAVVGFYYQPIVATAIVLIALINPGNALINDCMRSKRR